MFNIVVHVITINSILNRAHILDSLTDHLSPTNAEAVMGIEEYIRAVCPSQSQTQPLKTKPLKVYLKYIYMYSLSSSNCSVILLRGKFLVVFRTSLSEVVDILHGLR